MKNKIKNEAIGAVATAATAYLIKVAFEFLANKIRESRQSKYYSITLNSSLGETYNAGLKWLYTAGLRVSDKHHLYEKVWTRGPQLPATASFPKGMYAFKHKGCEVTVIKTEANVSLADSSEPPMSTIEMRFIGSSAQRLAKSVCRFIDAETNTDKLEVKRAAAYNPSTTYRSKRPLDSVILNDDAKRKLVEHLDWWKSSKQDFADHGIPYKTGILLEGPPGTGKTSLSLAIATYLDYNILYVSPASLKHNDQILNECDPKTVIVFEDFDKFFEQSTESEEDRKDKRHFAFENDNEKIQFMLSFLDGISSPEDAVFVMSTNFPEKIDPTLLRDGRVDLRIHMPLFDESLSKIMITSHGFDSDLFNELDKSTWESPPKLQGHLMRLKKARAYAKS